jgi:hypothetical protein
MDYELCGKGMNALRAMKGRKGMNALRTIVYELPLTVAATP